MDTETKFVWFGDYCSRCQYKDSSEGEDPCNECLGEPVNLNSHKPINFKEANK